MLHFPGIGEIIGGSKERAILDVLKTKMQKNARR